MRKSWKTNEQVNEEELAMERVRLNRKPEPAREYPGQIRMSTIPADSSVAQYVSSQPDFCKRKDFSPAKNKPDFDNTLPFFADDAFYTTQPPPAPEDEEEKKTAPSLDDDRFLRLDISKLPLEMFDSAEFEEKDKTPNEWINSCPSGAAAKFDGKEWKWRKVRRDKRWRWETGRRSLYSSRDSKY